jgi:hypothetical protein
MTMIRGFGFALLLAAGLSAGQSFAGDGHGHREAGAHAHGQGIFNIAIDGTAVQMEVIAPGADIVGFEHAPKSDEQKAALAAARAKLESIEAVMALPKAAGCSLVRTDVEGPGGDDRDGAKAHDHGHGASSGKDASADAHSEFHVTYTLTCASPAALDTLTFSYFESFKGAEALDVTVVSGKGQKAFEVRRGADTIRLDELL